MMPKWLRDSGLTIIEAKTEVCLFYARDHPVINFSVNETIVRSKKSINTFDPQESNTSNELQTCN